MRRLKGCSTILMSMAFSSFHGLVKFQPRSQGLSSSRPLERERKRPWFGLVFLSRSRGREDERPWERGWLSLRLKSISDVHDEMYNGRAARVR